MQANYQLIRSNVELRLQARNQLKGNWGNGALLTLIFTIIMSASLIIPPAIFIVTGPLLVGYCICFINVLRYRNLSIDNLFDGFKRFGTSLAAFFLILIILLGLFLLIFIPPILGLINEPIGAIFTIIMILTILTLSVQIPLAYAMVPFIIIDNPGISAIDSLKVSREMMKGFKSKFLSLNLSFMGWSILCTCCTCTIGYLWLTPYMFASYANFYENLREVYGMPMNTTNSFNAYNNTYSNFNNMNGNYNNNSYTNYNNNDFNHSYNDNYNNNYNNGFDTGFNNNYNNNNYNNSPNYNSNYNNNTPNYNNNYNNKSNNVDNSVPQSLRDLNNYYKPSQGNSNIVQKNQDEGIDKF